MDDELTYTAFAGDCLIVSGNLKTMLLETKARIERGERGPILIFEDQKGQQVDFDFRGTPAEVVARAAPVTTHAAPGRPKLGVICREVSLLPRHWDWLEQQPNGLSAALRRLVDQARKSETGEERGRSVREAASRFMWAMAGNFHGFEEASRALFAKDDANLKRLIRKWPGDVRKHIERLVAESRRIEGAASGPARERPSPSSRNKSRKRR